MWFSWRGAAAGELHSVLFMDAMQQQEKIILAARDLLGLSDGSGLMSFPDFITSADGLGLTGVYPFWLEEAGRWSEDVSSVVLTGSLGGGKCILDQRVVTSSGYRYISSLCPDAGDGWSDVNLLVEQEGGRFVRAVKFYKESGAGVNVIRGSRGVTYSGTDAHPIYAWRKGWDRPQLLRCGDLRAGDYIARLAPARWVVSSSQSRCQDSYRAGRSVVKHPEYVERWFVARDCAFFGLCGLIEVGFGDIRDNLLHFLISPDLSISVCEALDYLGLDYTRELSGDTVDVVLWSKSTQLFVEWWRKFNYVLGLGATPCLVGVCTMYLRAVRPEDAVWRSVLGANVDAVEERWGVSLDYVTSIERAEGTVYDLWVPETNLFQSRGTLNHNSSYANMLLCYYLYRVFSFGDLYSYYGIMRGTPIYILYFSVNLKTAERSGFKQLREMLDKSPWFIKHMPRDKSVDSSIRFGNGLNIEYASGESHAIGLSVVGTVLDEANFRRGVGAGLVSEYTEVQQLAQQLEDRLKSRFSRDGGTRMLSLMIYISSASYASSFIEEKMQELMGVRYGRVVRAVQYQICPQNYSSEFFEVFCGYQQLLPCVVQDAKHKATLVKAMGLPEVQCGGYFERVPEDFLPQFKKNIYLAIQNHCGRSTVAQGAFITNYAIVLKAYDDTVLAERPVSQDSIVVSDQDDVEISSIFDMDSYRYGDRPHSLTLDLALTGDHGSLCCVRADGVDSRGRAIHTEVFNLDIVPPQFPGMLHITKVEDFILWLSERVHIAAFSTDAFQSEQLRQNVCEQLGIANVRLSLDSSDIPALMWLSLLVDERARMQYLERQDREIREAVHDVAHHKVVKRSGSTDDQFQAMCGAFFLSETVGARSVDLSQLLGGRVNLCGEGPLRRMLSACGYDTSGLFFTKDDLRSIHKTVSGSLSVESGADVVRPEGSRASVLASLRSGDGRRGSVSVADILKRRTESGVRVGKLEDDRGVRRTGSMWSLIDMVDKL